MKEEKMTDIKIDQKLTFLAVLLLLIAIFFKLPYGYYTILRIVICAYFVYFIYLTYDKNRKLSLLCLLSVLIAIIYNPIIKIAFSKEIWSWINIFTLLILFIIGIGTQKVTKSKS